jgi:thymidylate synthase
MLDKAIKNLRQDLLSFGKEIITNNWQGTQNPPAFLELINAGFEAKMPETLSVMTQQCKPALPWAETHFAERVSGIPFNPPPSHVQWLKGTDDSLEANGKFSHSYPERMHKNLFTLVELFKKDPTTRQGFLPIWFEQDGQMALDNRRVPCTLGWHFTFRDGMLHCYYPMRSCDAVRHLHHDVYFAARLTLWIIQEANLHAVPGVLTFHAVSLHCFANDKYALTKLGK